MIRYVPPFILQNCEMRVLNGSLTAYVLLLDIADFTRVSSALQQEGKQGAEELRRYLDVALGTPIELVNKFGGFVSVFAGDAFCAIFPEAEPAAIISLVNSIGAYFQNTSQHRTMFGDFDLTIRQTICYGNIDWQIFENDLQNEYVFCGDAISELAELASCKADVLFSPAAAHRIDLSHFEKLNYGYSLTSKEIYTVFKPLEFKYSQSTKARFINPKYSDENPQNEIRQAAYCFANLVGITPSNREEAIGKIQNMADKYCGFVNKYDFTDKGLIAIIYFGLPKSDGKTLERICSFSLDVVECLPQIALGISCGSVFVGFIGNSDIKEYTALGHPMNLAARLMSKARHGEVLTDTYLWQEMQAHYDFDYLGSLNLKGFMLPVRYYALSRLSKDKTWHQESRFVGREVEIAIIRKKVETGIGNKENAIIYVSGDAGIGKSRLVREALAIYKEDQCHKFNLRCDAILPKPLDAIKQIVRSFFYYNPQLPKETGIAIFKGLWLAVALNDPELQRIESIIASFLDYEWEGSVWNILPIEEKPTQLRSAFIRFIEQLASNKPVLIHLDDGQWLDMESNIYFQELSNRSVAPFMIISSCRFLANGEKVDLNLAQHHRVDIELASLTDESSIELIRTTLRLDHVPIETANPIISRAMGNPFFIEQLTSYLMESGSIDDKGIITGELGYLSSFSISDIVSSRIDRLTEQVRECMFNASVLGMQFNIKVLSQMLNHQIDCELEIGTKCRLWLDFDELCYIFSHILIKDVVYRRMMSDKLSTLHQAAAEAMVIVFAEKLAEDAEEIAIHYEKGNNILKAAEYYDKAGCFYIDKYEFAKGEKNLKRALQIRETEQGCGHTDTALTLDNLACLYYHQGMYDQSEPIFLRALEIRETTPVLMDTDTADLLNNLAELYMRQGKYEQSEQLHLRALEIREKVLGAEHSDVASSIINIAGLYQSQGKYDQAEQLILKALGIYEKVFGAEHQFTAASLNCLAGVYQNQIKYDQAEPLYLRALEINTKVLGAEHPYTAASLNNLALLYYYQQKFDLAEPLFLRDLQTTEKVLGAKHPDTATSIDNLACLNLAQCKFEHAEPLFKQALEIRETVLGSEHPYTAISLANLARLYTTQSKFDQAEPLILRALEIREKSLGSEHPHTAISLSSLGTLYKDQGKLELAEPLFIRALEVREKVLGSEHPETAASLYNLACLNLSQSKYGQAESLFLRALGIIEAINGVEHPNTTKTINKIIELYELTYQTEKAKIYKQKLP